MSYGSMFQPLPGFSEPGATTQPHHCHAEGCKLGVPPRLLMCARHWSMVPITLKREVWATYRPGQEIDKKPSREYMKAAADAIAAVKQREGRAG